MKNRLLLFALDDSINVAVVFLILLLFIMPPVKRH